VQYFSESQKKYINIDEMEPQQLRNSLNKLGNDILRSKGPVSMEKLKAFDAMKREVLEQAARGKSGLEVPAELKREVANFMLKHGNPGLRAQGAKGLQRLTRRELLGPE
jgi:hypothetical protein